MTILYIIGAVIITFLITKNIYQPKVKKIEQPSIYEENFNMINKQKIEIVEKQLSELYKLNDELKKVGNRLDN
jgi:S-adenosylmethionine synthetase